MFLVLCALLAIVATPSTTGLAVQLVAYVAVAAAVGLLGRVLASWKTVGWLIFSLLIVYAWAYPGSTQFVWIFGVQGFERGVLIAVRLLDFVTVLYLLLLSTGPLPIVEWAGDINEDLGIMISLTLSVIPVMKHELDTTLEAQQARGLDISGNVVAKLKAYVVVLIPVVVKSLMRAYAMAGLLVTRGYGSGRRIHEKHPVTPTVVVSYVVGTTWVAAAVALAFIDPVWWSR